MPQISEEDLQILHTLLDAEPEALARYNKLADYKKEMCLRWIADAPAPLGDQPPRAGRPAASDSDRLHSSRFRA